MICEIDWNLIISIWALAVAVVALLDQLNKK